MSDHRAKRSNIVSRIWRFLWNLEALRSTRAEQFRSASQSHVECLQEGNGTFERSSRVFTWVFLTVTGTTLVGPLFHPSEALAMDQASATLSRRETNLRTAVATTATKAQVVELHVESPDCGTA